MFNTLNQHVFEKMTEKYLFKSKYEIFSHSNINILLTFLTRSSI